MPCYNAFFIHWSTDNGISLSVTGPSVRNAVVINRRRKIIAAHFWMNPSNVSRINVQDKQCDRDKQLIRYLKQPLVTLTSNVKNKTTDENVINQEIILQMKKLRNLLKISKLSRKMNIAKVVLIFFAIFWIL